MKVRLLPFLAVALFAIQSSAFGEPQVKQDSKGIPIEVSNLDQGGNVSCQRTEFLGQVAARDFAKNAMDLTGITLEDADGVRTFINVEVWPNLRGAFGANLASALQKLSKVGRNVAVQAYVCGTGRVIVLDEIR